MERKRIVDQVVCSFLYSRASHGYEIYEVLKRNNVEKFIDFSKATIYNSLKRLEKNLMLDSTYIENENKPPKTTYILNSLGKKYLIELVEESLSSCRFENVFVTNLGFHFHHLLDFNKLIELINKRLALYSKLKENFEKKKKYASTMDTDLFYLEVIMTSNIMHISGEIYKMEALLEKYNSDKNFFQKSEERFLSFTEKLFNESLH